MHILIITETFLPSTDGVVTRLTNSIRYFMNQGHKVTIIAPDLGVSEFEGAKVIGIRASKLFFYRSKAFALPNRRIKQLIADVDPDVVHVVNPALVGASGVYYAKNLQYPLVASYHTQVPRYADYYHLSIFKGLLWWYFRKLHNQATINLCTSNVVKEELDQQNFRNVHVWKRGVDTKLFHPDHEDEAMRNRLTNNQKSKTILLYVGRLAPEKEIEKIRNVLESSDKFVLAIVGDGPHRAPLEKYFEGTNTIFTGLMHGNDLATAYASADVFVFPSTTETLGLVLSEAMASGLPIVAADSGPTREQIQHETHGLLYDQHSVESFTETVLRLEDESLRQRLAESAWQDIHEMGWDEQSKQALDIYQQAISMQANHEK
ncbi:glycosyltransferase family 4 protein [Gracilibacillus salinarum]|uniref:Glycosyltransferase family 1 protein n=1 Tax=Gracilibacillus salinarum TaxID=2932255 RepID=A0ABY4GK35_9BACI|nr:glycosyltransferase family 1 protein [Gracilibacillus salinarum]UOQ84558.1 glycosyltransferase family 1 protein [Gracilibacillus salinarum]